MKKQIHPPPTVPVRVATIPYICIVANVRVASPNYCLPYTVVINLVHPGKKTRTNSECCTPLNLSSQIQDLLPKKLALSVTAYSRVVHVASDQHQSLSISPSSSALPSPIPAGQGIQKWNSARIQDREKIIFG
jgi:hypothetical protein